MLLLLQPHLIPASHPIEFIMYTQATILVMISNGAWAYNAEMAYFSVGEDETWNWIEQFNTVYNANAAQATRVPHLRIMQI